MTVVEGISGLEEQLLPLVQDYCVRPGPEAKWLCRREKYTPTDLMAALSLCPSWIALDSSGEPVGWVGLSVGVGLHEARLEANCFGIYAKPGAGREIADVLIETAEEWARENGVARIVYATQLASLVRWGKRRGYEFASVLCAKEL